MTEEIKSELDVKASQQPEEIVYDNPLRTNLDTDLVSDTKDGANGVNKKRKDPKIVLLSGLFIFLILLLILSLLASVFVPKKKTTLLIQPTEVPVQPTSGPVINRVEIPIDWQEKLRPAVQMLDRLNSLQTNEEFLPPTFDANIGLN